MQHNPFLLLRQHKFILIGTGKCHPRLIVVEPVIGFVYECQKAFPFEKACRDLLTVAVDDLGAATQQCRLFLFKMRNSLRNDVEKASGTSSCYCCFKCIVKPAPYQQGLLSAMVVYLCIDQIVCQLRTVGQTVERLLDLAAVALERLFNPHQVRVTFGVDLPLFGKVPQYLHDLIGYLYLSYPASKRFWERECFKTVEVGDHCHKRKDLLQTKNPLLFDQVQLTFKVGYLFWWRKLDI